MNGKRIKVTIEREGDEPKVLEGTAAVIIVGDNGEAATSYIAAEDYDEQCRLAVAIAAGVYHGTFPMPKAEVLK